MAIPVLTIISGLVALSDAALSVVDRFSRGELTDEELQIEEAKIRNRILFAEKVLASALARRAERKA